MDPSWIVVLIGSVIKMDLDGWMDGSWGEKKRGGSSSSSIQLYVYSSLVSLEGME